MPLYGAEMKDQMTSNREQSRIHKLTRLLPAVLGHGPSLLPRLVRLPVPRRFKAV
jgi:hypothetical protein